MAKGIKKRPTTTTVLEKALAKMVAGLNLNTLVIAILGTFFGYKSTVMDTKQDTALQKQAQSQAWQAKRDSINKIMFAKQDSILTILKTKK